MSPYLDPNGDIASGTYDNAIKAIHTDVVRDSISRQGPNRVLGYQAPPNSAKENCFLAKLGLSYLN